MTKLNHKPNTKQANVCPPLQKDASGLDKLVYWLGIGLGSGKPKQAPGTWGSLAGLLVALPLMMLGFVTFLAITVLANVIGIWICNKTSHLMGVHDDPHIVWDEWTGIWIALLPYAYYMGSRNFYTVTNLPVLLIILANTFVLFRIFDIFKPFPIGYLDKKVSGGLGIMLDDMLAGAIVAIIMLFCLTFVVAVGLN
ncbi:MAG: phosphatidylglycerophosphatase A [Gammaproteobacteria bacterium]|nr:MAG: phosphatidylglycerophosphatase A [Gammaproteobacteria bacterium]